MQETAGNRGDHDQSQKDRNGEEYVTAQIKFNREGLEECSFGTGRASLETGRVGTHANQSFFSYKETSKGSRIVKEKRKDGIKD